MAKLIRVLSKSASGKRLNLLLAVEVVKDTGHTIVDRKIHFLYVRLDRN
jgi:hypothetical protein